MFHEFVIAGNLRAAIMYGDEITYDERDKFLVLLAQAGWQPAGWAAEAAADMGGRIQERPALADALIRAAVAGMPVVVPDLRDVRSPSTLLKIALVAALVGVEVHTLKGRVLDAPTVRDEAEFVVLTVVTDVLALRDAVLGAFSLRPESLTALVDPVPPHPAAASGEPVASVTPIRQRHLDRYREYVKVYEEIWKFPPPPLPDPAQPFSTQKRVIGRLAQHLFTHGWFDKQTAGLLNELGIRTDQGVAFYASLVAYYRRAYGKAAA